MTVVSCSITRGEQKACAWDEGIGGRDRGAGVGAEDETKSGQKTYWFCSRDGK